MNLNNNNNNIFIPDGCNWQQALERTTHLCIGAHQDDIEIFAYHGIAECFRNASNWFAGVVVTNGSGSPRSNTYEKISDEEMQKIRILEQQKAAFIGEYTAQIQLGYSSASVKYEQTVVDDLEKILSIAKPKIIYLHNPADKHDTHVAVLLRSLEAIHRMPIEKRPSVAYGCEVWRGLDWLVDKDKKMLPVDKYKNIAQSLVGVFDSQISGGKRYDLATSGRYLSNATYLDSHKEDAVDAITWAMDLTPLVQDENICLEEYTLQYIENLKQDISQRIQKFRK